MVMLVDSKYLMQLMCSQPFCLRSSVFNLAEPPYHFEIYLFASHVRRTEKSPDYPFFGN